MTEIVKCIDISHHQGSVEFEEVKRAGVLGMIHKATEGTGFIDDMRAENCAAAIDAGIACSTYHWLKPGNAAAQMSFYLDTVDPVKGERVVIDYEENGCTLDDLYEAVERLLDDPRGLQITVYSGHLLKEQLGDKHDSLLASNTDLWLAQYTTGEPSWSNETYPQWALWQYSENGEVSGIDDAYVDLDRFNGDDGALVKWISPKDHVEPKPPRPPRPPPPLPSELVKVAITAPIPVRVSVNGVTMRRRIRRLVKRGPDVVR